MENFGYDTKKVRHPRIGILYQAVIPPLQSRSEYGPPQRVLADDKVVRDSDDRNDDDVRKFWLGLHAFGKSFDLVKVFTDKNMGDIMFHYYAKFCTCGTWRERRKCRSTCLSRLSAGEIVEVLAKIGRDRLKRIKKQLDTFVKRKMNKLIDLFKKKMKVFEDIFWYGVWHRLLAAGWRAEMRKEGHLVFLVPGVERWGPRLVKDVEYFDSFIDVLCVIAENPTLLLRDEEEEKHMKRSDEKKKIDYACNKLKEVRLTATLGSGRRSLTVGECSSSSAALTACSKETNTREVDKREEPAARFNDVCGGSQTTRDEENTKKRKSDGRRDGFSSCSKRKTGGRPLPEVVNFSFGGTSIVVGGEEGSSMRTSFACTTTRITSASAPTSSSYWEQKADTDNDSPYHLHATMYCFISCAPQEQQKEKPKDVVSPRRKPSQEADGPNPSVDLELRLWFR